MTTSYFSETKKVIFLHMTSKWGLEKMETLVANLSMFNSILEKEDNQKSIKLHCLQKV